MANEVFIDMRYIKLVKNYRSHEAILRYPNEKFYEGELEACGPHAQINHFIGSPQIVSPKFPVVFHAVSGQDEREASSPSYFNIEEASQVKAYVEALLQDAAFPIGQSVSADERRAEINI